MEIWEPLIELSEEIKSIFESNFERYDLGVKYDFDGWEDSFWKSDQVRKCHLKTIDNRETQKTWLMHINIFPTLNKNVPILGFDIVAGASKITGSFFDFSPVSGYHPYMQYFKKKTENLEWNKKRELPEWARNIFSDSMIAAGNIKEIHEINQLKEVSLDLIKYYVQNLQSDSFICEEHKIKPVHNYYCQQQKLNPHLHRSILAMGISEEDKNNYVNKALFEEI